MRIRWTGPGVVRRIVEPYEWSRATGFVQDVELGRAAELLTDPTGQFVVDGSEPLVEVVITTENAAGLAVAGIGDLAGLAELSPEEMREVAAMLGVSGREVWGWIKQARKMLGIDEQVAEDQEV